jgi:hypothetical protein
LPEEKIENHFYENDTIDSKPNEHINTPRLGHKKRPILPLSINEGNLRKK